MISKNSESSSDAHSRWRSNNVCANRNLALIIKLIDSTFPYCASHATEESGRADEKQDSNTDEYSDKRRCGRILVEHREPCHRSKHHLVEKGSQHEWLTQIEWQWVGREERHEGLLNLLGNCKRLHAKELPLLKNCKAMPGMQIWLANSNFVLPICSNRTQTFAFHSLLDAFQVLHAAILLAEALLLNCYENSYARPSPAAYENFDTIFCWKQIQRNESQLYSMCHME